MRNNVLTVMKKECKRIFSDRKLFFTTVLLPGILMFTMYTFMGTFFAAFFDVDDDYYYQIHAVNLPGSISVLLSDPELRLEILPTPDYQADEIKEKIANRETDLLLVFPADFDARVAVFRPETAAYGEFAPNVEIWSNHARTESGDASSIVRGVITDYHHRLAHRFTINAPTDAAPDGNFNLATDADMFAMLIGMIVPLLFIIFIYTGCQSIAPESIAGEKERGTLGSMLVTPAKRRDLALGKILGIGVFGMMSAIVSILGAVLAMPNMMMGIVAGSIFDMYSVVDFALLLLLAGSTTLVFVSVLSVLSAYAKSVKEANAYAMPILIVVFLAGLSGMILGGIPTDITFYLIPIVNSALGIAAIFSFEANTPNILVAAGTNIAVTLIFTVILARIFSSEKII